MTRPGTFSEVGQPERPERSRYAQVLEEQMEVTSQKLADNSLNMSLVVTYGVLCGI